MSDNEFLTQPEAASYLKRTRQALYQLMHRGRLPYSRPAGGKVYFLRSDLDAFMSSNRRCSAAELADRADALLMERR